LKDYKKYYTINATPDQVYLALTTETTLHLWTGEMAVMKAEPGTEFSLWEGSIVGKNLEFEPAKKIVQQWYFGEEGEPSIVTIKLHSVGETETSAELRHTNIPDAEFDDITEGWNNVYFASLQEFYR
jgi:activator of HSP90 ATPase